MATKKYLKRSPTGLAGKRRFPVRIKFEALEPRSLLASLADGIGSALDIGGIRLNDIEPGKVAVNEFSDDAANLHADGEIAWADCVGSLTNEELNAVKSLATVFYCPTGEILSNQASGD